MKARLYAAAIAILVTGVGCGLLIYFTADEDSVNLTIDEMRNSKMYIHQLRNFGGKAAVLFAGFNDWFAGLWHGKALGKTIAGLSVVVSFVVFLFSFNRR